MRPREMYTIYGPDQRTDAELLALIIGTGAAGQSSQELAEGLLARFGDLRGLAETPVEALRKARGIGPARAVRLHAAIQLGKRAAATRGLARHVVITPDDAWQLLRPGLEHREAEELHALYLDRKRAVLGLRDLTRGSESATVVEPRQIFRMAVQVGASALIVAHNHPSGDPAPSDDDLAATRRLVSAGRLLGVPLLDHLIIGHGCYVSLQAEGVVPPA